VCTNEGAPSTFDHRQYGDGKVYRGCRVDNGSDGECCNCWKLKAASVLLSTNQMTGLAGQDIINLCISGAWASPAGEKAELAADGSDSGSPPGTECHITGNLTKGGHLLAHIDGAQAIQESGSVLTFVLIYRGGRNDTLSGQVEGCAPQVPWCDIKWAENSTWSQVFV